MILTRWARRPAGSPLAWIAFGLSGSIVLALAGSRVGPLPGSGGWWLALPGSQHGGALLLGLFYAGMAAVVLAWLGLGAWARAGRLRLGTALGALTAWGLPLVLGPPLFSRDVYSYMAQGLLANRGLDPYSFGPVALGHGAVLASVAHPWRATPAPYGPLFLDICRLASSVFGRSIVLEVTVFRLLSLVGVGLLAACLPGLARRLGADPGMALWLGVLSPVALFSFVASGHNDVLMAGLVVAGVVLLFRGRPGLALLACSTAGTIKISAFAAVAFVAVYSLRTLPRERRLRGLVVGTAAVALPIVGTTWAAGLGWGWLSPAVLSVPGHLLLGYAPAPALGLTLFHGLHLVGVHLPRRTLISAVEAAGGVGAIALGARLALGSDLVALPTRLAVVLLGAVLAGPALWPWYLTWSLVLWAATPHQRSWTLAGMSVLAAFLVAPTGTPVLRGPDYFVVAALVAASGLWLARHGRWRQIWMPSLALAPPGSP